MDNEAAETAPIAHRIRETPDRKREALELRLSGMTFKEVSQKTGISTNTILVWASKERSAGTEIGRRLCQMKSTGKVKEPLRTVTFPGGSTYVEGHKGKLVLKNEPEEVPAIAAPPVPAVKSQGVEESFIDDVLEEVAMQLGKAKLENIILKMKLERAGKK